MKAGRILAVALAGGNALGAFEAGALAAIARSGRTVSIVAGASAGSINTVLFAAPRNGDPVRTLELFWGEAEQELFSWTRRGGEYMAALSSLLFGRPGLSVSYAMAAPTILAGRNALQDLTPLAGTLSRLVSFEQLSNGSPRCLIGATALDPDEPHIFDTARMPLRPEHVLASGALPVLYPPVLIEGRSYVDGGVTANLPLECLLEIDEAMDCLALDLFATGGPVPNSLDASIERLQSQMFAFQSERVLEKVARSERDIRVIYSAYRPASRESAGKTLDFSRGSLEKRWSAGEAAMTLMLERLAAAPTGEKVERV